MPGQQSVVARCVAPLRARQRSQSTPDWQARCLQPRRGELSAALYAWLHPEDWQWATTHSSQRPRAGACSRSQDTQDASNVLFESRKASGRDPPPRRASAEARRPHRIRRAHGYVQASLAACLSYLSLGAQRGRLRARGSPLSAHPIASVTRASPRAQVHPSASPTHRWTKGRTARGARRVRCAPARGVPEPSSPRLAAGRVPIPHPHPSLVPVLAPAPAAALHGHYSTPTFAASPPLPALFLALLIGGCNVSRAGV